MAGSTIKEAADELEMDISSQENVSRRAGTSGRSSKQHVRHRASIACFSCRDRRIRCVVPKGRSGCIQCKRSGTECVIKMDDERRRPISKAYVSSLSTRIAMLESMLQEKGVAVPKATHPPITKHEARYAGSGDEIQMPSIEVGRHSKSNANSPTRHVLSPPYSHEDFTTCESPMEDLGSIDIPQSGDGPLWTQQSPFQTPDRRREGAIHRLFFPKGGLSCDRFSGELRFFGPTANCHVHAESTDRYGPRESPEQVRRAERIIRSLTPQTHEYLMQNFWKYHNSVLHVVDRAAFEADKGSENPKYYSSFLHIIILAVGWRFADKDRYEVARISQGNYESMMHKEARRMLDVELERPTGIPSIQSLLLLGDLECGAGRDYTGWMYAGMANRLAFEIGLHINNSSARLPEREASVRRRVMKACILYDRYWALFLGRPTSIKTRDVGLDLSNAAASAVRPARNCSGSPTDPRLVEEEIHEQLIELMDLAGQIVEHRGINQNWDPATLKKQLQEWYGRLPEHLRWGPENIRTAPCSYFLLHEQYHAVIIILYRSSEAYRSLSRDGLTGQASLNSKGALKMSEASEANRFSNSAREIGSHNQTPSAAINYAKSVHNSCTQAAIQFAQIAAEFKEKYETEKMCCTSLQPAGTASIALLSAIALPNKNEEDRRLYLSSLEVVTDTIQSMSRLYEPAARMGDLIQAVLAQVNPTGRGSQHEDEDASLEQDMRRSNGSEGGQYNDNHMFSFARAHRNQEGGAPLLHQHSENPYSLPTQVAFKPAGSSSPFQTPPSSYGPDTLGHYSNAVSGPMPTFSDSSGASFYLDPIYTPTIRIDGTHPGRYGSDNYLRLAPSAKGWDLQSLHSLHAASQPEQPLNSHMPDWIGGSASLGDTAALSTGVGPDLHTNGMSACKREDTASLVWGLDTLNPASPKGFVQNSEKVEFNHDNIATRNHELDFLSL